MGFLLRIPFLTLELVIVSLESFDPVGLGGLSPQGLEVAAEDVEASIFEEEEPASTLVNVLNCQALLTSATGSLILVWLSVIRIWVLGPKL